MLYKEKILIGGGSGYVGAVLCPLLSKYYDITVIDNLWFGNNLPNNIKVINADLKDLKKDDYIGYDQFIFLGGVSNDPMAEFSPLMNFTENTAVPTNCAFLAKQAGVKRFIFASTCSVYGYTLDQVFTEEDPTTCAYPYGLSKIQAEKGLIQLQDDNFSVICIRKGTVCGYGPRVRFDLVINTMFKFAMTTSKITVSNPNLNRPILSIQDAAQGYLKAVQSDLSVSGIFNIASENYSLLELGMGVKNKIEELSGKEIKLKVNNIPDMRNYKVSIDKAKNILGFNPKSDIDDIVSELYSHIDEYGDYEDDKFYNIKTFKKLKFC
jgi:nucleoside-diphosphate-sugar epimerase